MYLHITTCLAFVLRHTLSASHAGRTPGSAPQLTALSPSLFASLDVDSSPRIHKTLGASPLTVA